MARDRVVDYMKTNENAITQFGERYLAESRIPDEGIWATEAEIMASAAMLQTDIYVLCSVAGSLVWQNYAAHLLGSGAKEDRCIYIVNDSGNHFDYVYSLQKYKLENLEYTITMLRLKSSFILTKHCMLSKGLF